MTHTYTPPASAQPLRLVAAWTNWEFPPFPSPPELALAGCRGPEEVPLWPLCSRQPRACGGPLPERGALKVLHLPASQSLLQAKAEEAKKDPPTPTFRASSAS